MAEMILKATGSKLKIISEIHVTSTQAQYDTCLFEFDEAWGGYGVRTAVFYSRPDNIKAVLLDADNRCFIPWDAFSNSRYLYIGVYGSNGESYLPTQFVEVMYQPGAMLDDHLYPPTPGIYEQIISYIATINATIREKADAYRVDALDAQIEALGSASPKGAFATLAELQASFPGGASGIYVIQENGNWYYWSGDTWVDGGVYQGTQLSDYAVTEKKVKLYRSGNLYKDHAQLDMGYYYSSAGVRNAGNGLANIKIPITAGQILCMYTDFTGISSLGIYVKSDGTFVRSVFSQSHSLTERSDYLCIQAPPLPEIGFVYINVRAEKSTMDLFYAIKLLEEAVSSNINTISSGMLSNDVPKTDNRAVIANLFSKELAMKNFYIHPTTGEFVTKYAVASLPPIAIVPGDTIEIENAMCSPGDITTLGVFLDTDYQIISSVIPNGMGGSAIAPVDAAFFVPTLTNAAVDAGVCKIYHVSTSPGLKINKFAIYPANSQQMLSGKRWASLGDSITFSETWQPLIAEQLALIHINCGLGSSALSGTAGAVRPSFWEDKRLGLNTYGAVKTAVSDGVTHGLVIPNNPDIVTILGGANDLGLSTITIGAEDEFTKPLASKNKTTFLGAYSYIVEQLLTWKPTLRIIILGTTWAKGNGTLNRPLGSTLTYTDFSEASRKVAAHYGLPFVDLHGESGFNAYTMGANPNNIYSDDQIHPNNAGGKRIAELVLSTIKRTMCLP
ncbi:MAG: hypothetical protein GX540_04210 [Clostridiales bacterium]|nr:hypothetical protein [Clostridiales bacterium]